MTKEMKDLYKYLYTNALAGKYGIGSERENFFKSIGLIYSEVKAVASDPGKKKK